MSYDNETSENQKKICNLFASFFISVYCEAKSSLLSYSELSHLDYINSIDITESDVFLPLNNLANKTKIAIDDTTNIVSIQVKKQ